MFRMIPSLILACLFVSPAHAESSLTSVVCRSYDHFQMGGDRKTLEIALAKQPSGKYELLVSRTFDVLQPNHEYLERNRYTETKMSDLNCVQAPDSVDPLVVTCTGVNLKSYFNIARLDRTLILSELSSRPREVVKTVTYEANVMGDKNAEYQNLYPKDCVVK